MVSFSSLKESVSPKTLGISAAALVSSYFLLPALRLYLLRKLLRYQGWIHNQRSTWSYIHVMIVHFLVGSSPKFHSLQDALPPLPIPELSVSLRKYLEGVHPLLTKVEFERTVAAVKDFERPHGVGISLQADLVAHGAAMNRQGKSWLEKLWEETAYLKNRAPLPTASTWYATDQPQFNQKGSQILRAARVTRALVDFFILMRDQELTATVTPVPLCMNQYRRLFSTTRLPGETVDEIVQYSTSISKHVIVIRKGQFYVLPAFHATGAPLNADDLYSQFEHIVKDADKRTDTFLPVGVLTGDNRSKWYQNRKKLIALSKENELSIQIIESAMFCVSLEDSSPMTPEDFARAVWYGNGHNRWFDKSFHLVITDNGQAGVCAEHSYVDVMVLAHMFDHAFSLEGGTPVDYTVARPVIAAPKKLRIIADEQFNAEVFSAGASLERTFKELDISCLDFRSYGKRFLKQMNLSPDGFVQMALQLAYFRLCGQHTLTYETAHTRLFRHGRTECVQSCTDESVAFIESMTVPTATREQRQPLLVHAIDRHVQQTRDAMIGRGYYRHLFGLRCMWLRRNPAPPVALFKDKGFLLPYNLVTSQTTAQRIHGGGFAPWSENGIAISYMVNEGSLRFHFICHKGKLAADQIASTVERCLLEMQGVVYSDSKLKKYASSADLNEITGPGWVDSH